MHASMLANAGCAWNSNDSDVMQLLHVSFPLQITDSEMHSQFNNVMLSYMVNFFILKLMIS